MATSHGISPFCTVTPVLNLLPLARLIEDNYYVMTVHRRASGEECLFSIPETAKCTIHKETSIWSHWNRKEKHTWVKYFTKLECDLPLAKHSFSTRNARQTPKPRPYRFQRDS